MGIAENERQYKIFKMKTYNRANTAKVFYTQQIQS